jgi:hypothetical protein
VVEKPRLIMALGAGDIPVTGGLPGFDVGTHLMTETTEGGGLGKSEKAYRDDQKSNDTENE